MATRMLRRGLPRVPGGEPWPPAVEAEADVDEAGASDLAAAPVIGSPAAPASGTGPQMPSTLRRGLPRVVGGEPWPPATTVTAAMAPAADAAERATPVVSVVPETPKAPATRSAAEPSAAPMSAPVGSTATRVAGDDAPRADDSPVRRGLPRVVGGEPWPPAGTRPTAHPIAGPGGPSTETALATASVPAPALLAPSLDTPLPFSRTVWNGRAPRRLPAAPVAASGRPRPSWPQAIAVLFGAASLGVLAGAAVALVRALLSTPFLQDFLAAFPGEYESPVEVAPGFAPWVGWQHFFNAFLIVLIIRSGLRVRSEKRPTAFWTPRNDPKGKISLTLWFHQALDLLWILNGVVFVVLLVVTGHWVRIVPTSWEVFPNALSAALQYVSFDWPHENGWNNYNSLQQLAYFATVFIAAPLAVVTGFRMSGLWPKKAERLSKAYPVEWARALHFPVMLYFVAFIVAHVALVLLTGFLRNLNHMYAAQDAVTWTGFWVFVVSLLVMAGGWFAARPLVLAPIAKLFGSVSGR